MVKRFRQHKVVWLNYATFLLQQGQSDAANSLLQRALKSMPSKESKMASPSQYIIYCFVLEFFETSVSKTLCFFSKHSGQRF